MPSWAAEPYLDVEIVIAPRNQSLTIIIFSFCTFFLWHRQANRTVLIQLAVVQLDLLLGQHGVLQVSRPATELAFPHLVQVHRKRREIGLPRDGGRLRPAIAEGVQIFEVPAIGLGFGVPGIRHGADQDDYAKRLCCSLPPMSG